MDWLRPWFHKDSGCDGAGELGPTKEPLLIMGNYLSCRSCGVRSIRPAVSAVYCVAYRLLAPNTYRREAHEV